MSSSLLLIMPSSVNAFSCFLSNVCAPIILLSVASLLWMSALKSPPMKTGPPRLYLFTVSLCFLYISGFFWVCRGVHVCVDEGISYGTPN